MEPPPLLNPKLMENFKMPSIEELLVMLETMDMDPEEKIKLKESLMDRTGGGGQSGQGPPLQIQQSYNQYFVLLIMLAIIVLVFAFFGYKLYKSLVDKQRKREDKVKAKQAKKKK